ncbi:MAG: hypothetical protein ACFFBY_01515 [Promethearchaeota archaeon]
MSDEVSEESVWTGMIRKYWYAIILYGIAIIGAIIGVILVFLTFIAAPDIAGGGTWTFAQFSVGALILWFIFLFLWELLLVGLPVIGYLAIVTVIFWFVVLSEEDKAIIKSREKKERKVKKTSGGSGAAGFLFFIAFILVLVIDGNLFAAFDTLPYTYFLFAYLVGVMWTVIVLGIPVLIIVIIYYGYKESKKQKSE